MFNSPKKKGKSVKVAMIAPPWLKVPAGGYGGVEAVIDDLCRGLNELGVQVELFAVGGSTAVADRKHWHHEDEQFKHFMEPMYDTAAIPMAHLLDSLDQIRMAGDFDIIHDHNNLFGPALLRDRPDLPPVLHTLHWTLRLDPLREGNVDTAKFYDLLGRGRRLFFNGISNSQVSAATLRLRSRVVGVVHHGIDLGKHTLTIRKENYYATVGRLSPVKGIGLAAAICKEIGADFRIAGQVGGLNDARKLEQTLREDPRGSGHPDLAYYVEEVAPHLVPGHIEYVGAVSGQAWDELVGRAKAFLMPIQWDEPFGVAVIEALACGTPVVAMRRGSMSEIIEHGVNGFLADSPEEFREYMGRVNEIDPMDCRRTVEERFSYQQMSRQYLKLYRSVLSRVPVPVSLPAPISKALGRSAVSRLGNGYGATARRTTTS